MFSELYTDVERESHTETHQCAGTEWQAMEKKGVCGGGVQAYIMQAMEVGPQRRKAEIQHEVGAPSHR